MLNKLVLKKGLFKKFFRSERGATDGILMTVGGLFIAATLMFLIPILSVTGQNDEIAQNVAEKAIADFLDTVSLKKVITDDDWNKLNSELSTTGNTFEITVEIQHLDENIGKKSVSGTGDVIGENVRYSTYISDANLEELEKDYPLRRGDIVKVTVKNTNKTMAQTVRSFMFKVTGKNDYDIMATDSRGV